MNKYINRLLSKLALIGKMSPFCADFLINFESLCEHMVEKFIKKDTKKEHFNNRMEFRKKSDILLALLLFTSCQNEPSQSSNYVKDHETIKEKIERLHYQYTYKTPRPRKIEREEYPWEVGRVGKLPVITKEFFRCKGCVLNPIKKIEQRDRIVNLQDCGGDDEHGLPLKNGQEFIYPILIELLNYIQVRTEKKVMITSGHRCPKHNTYVDPSKNLLYSKHQLGAEVAFYVEGLENYPEKIVPIIQEYYQKESPYKDKLEFREFKRYEKEDVNVATQPWMNKEVFIKVFSRWEGRNFDNRHPYPYLSIQVRYDPMSDENVIYTWKKAHMEFLRK